MADRTLDLETMQRVALFEKVTRVDATDLVESDTTAFFVIPKGAARKLRGSKAVDRLARQMGKSIELVELRSEPEAFVRSLFHRYGVQEVSCERTEGGISARVSVSPLRKGRAIGKGGSTLKCLRELARRHVGVTELILE